MKTSLNITNINLEIKEILEKDRAKLGLSQREYIEYLVIKENERLKDDSYLLKRIKER